MSSSNSMGFHFQTALERSFLYGSKVPSPKFLVYSVSPPMAKQKKHVFSAHKPLLVKVNSGCVNPLLSVVPTNLQIGSIIPTSF